MDRAAQFPGCSRTHGFRQTGYKPAHHSSQSNVIFIDRQPKNKIPQYYAASDVCLVTLRKTPLFKTVIPSKMFEIMAMEKPVILSVNGESKEILEKAKAGIHVEPENVDMLKNAILNLYQNPEKAKQLGTNGRRFVKEFYNRNKLAKDYIDILSP